MSAEILWNKVRNFFDTNDGSLPEIDLIDLTTEQVSSLYKEFRDGTVVVTENPYFWDNELNKERNIDEVDNAAVLVSSGVADSFHFCIDGFVSSGVEIPCLGISICPNSVIIDYRMGPEWNKYNVYALFNWLKQFSKNNPNAKIIPEMALGDDRDPEDFDQLLEEFIA